MKKAVLSAILAALCLASVVGCGDSTAAQTPADTDATAGTEAVTEAETEPGYPAPDTSNYDFGGQTVHFIAPEWSTYTYYYTEDLDGEAVNDAAYTRLSNVKNDLNVDIEWTWSTDQNTHTEVRKTITAGDDAYDIVFTHSVYGLSDYATSHCLYNLDVLPNVDFNAPWWSRSMMEDFRVGSETYYGYGDIILSNNNCVFFNKTIANDNDMPDHYQLVRDGKWTYDLFLSEAKSISRDVNGDGKINENDMTGYTGDLTEALCNVPYACGKRLTKTTDAGLELDFLDEKMLEIFQKTYDYFTDSNVSNGFFRSKTDIQQGFDEGLALFTFSSIKGMTGLRESNVDFGTLPYPKYDEAQENYQTYAWPTFVCVPTTITRPELVGAALEQFAYESTAVRDAYYEILVRGKSTRDVESLEMLDIIDRSVVCESTSSYLAFDSSYHKLFYVFLELLPDKKSDLSSHYAKSEKGVQKVIDKLYDDIISAQES